MKYTAVLAVLAGIAAAQSINDVPECARSCISTAATAAGCGASDLSCMCKNRDKIVSGPAATCALNSCQEKIGMLLLSITLKPTPSLAP